MTTGLAGRSLATLCLGGAILAGVADSVGSWYRYASESRWKHQTTLERQRIANQQRPVLLGEALEDNAATRYRAAFESLRKLPSDNSQRIRATVQSGFAKDSKAARGLLMHRCNGLSRIREALRCKYCDWHLGYAPQDPQAFGYFQETRLTADCLALDGQRMAYEHDRMGAARSYLEETSFGSDLGAGDLIMNLVGMAISTEGLRALGSLVTSTEDEGVSFAEVLRQLADLESSLPSLTKGLRFERLRLAPLLALEERAHVGTLPSFFGFPWRAYAAWRLSRDEVLLSRLQRGGDSDDPKQWERAISDLEQRSNVIGEDLPYLREALPASDRLRQLYRATLVALRLREWHVSNGSYPVDLTELGPPIKFGDMAYAQTDGGGGYKLWCPGATTEGGDALVLASRSANINSSAR